MHHREICSQRNYLLAVAVDWIHGEVVTCDKGLTSPSLVIEEWQDQVVLSTSERESERNEKRLCRRFYKVLHWLRFGDLILNSQFIVVVYSHFCEKIDNSRANLKEISFIFRFMLSMVELSTLYTSLSPVTIYYLQT